MSNTARIPEMPPSDAGLLWFVAVVEARFESIAAGDIGEHGLRTYLPKYTVKRRPLRGRKRKDIQRPLLPGYLFVGLDVRFLNPRFSGWALVRGADHVHGVLGTSNGLPLRVSWKEIADIQSAEDMGLFDDEIRLKIGEEVQILDGPFAFFSGAVERLRDDLITIGINIFGRPTPVSVNVSQIRRVGKAA